MSLGWKAIEHGLSLLKEGIISRVGNGRLVRIWCDPWLPRDFSRRPISSKGTSRLKCVLDLINEDGSWNIHKINQYFLPLDAEIILRIRLPVREEEDFIAWHPIKHGRFSVRSAYSWALKLKNMSKCSGSSSEISCKAWDLIWKNAAPQKVKIFARKVAVNCLATKENKFKRTLESDALCSICGTANEDTAHALCQCPQARSLWLSMYDAGTILSVPAVGRMNPNWLFDQLAMLSEDERMVSLMIMWRNWYIQNEITHDKLPPPIESSKWFLQSYISSLFNIRQQSPAGSVKGKAVIPSTPRRCRGPDGSSSASKMRWERPQEGWMKANVDGSFDSQQLKGGIGVVIRDWEGAVIFASCTSVSRCSSPLEA